MKNNYKKFQRLLCSGILVAQGLYSVNALCSTNQAQGDTIKNILKGRAVLPAATFAPGPTSGKRIGSNPQNGQEVPFINKQPVQGFSAVLKSSDGNYLAMSDNGFGSFENSADYHLRVYTIKPDFRTSTGGTGQISVVKFFELRDPDKKIPFTLTNHFTTDRILTGADFDIESMQRVKDGSFYFGDEFGPFLIHTDSTGKVLEAPIPLPDLENPGKEVRAPQNPYSEESSAIRIMNAVTTHARLHGGTKTPLFSPNSSMVDDGNLNTFMPTRKTPGTSGLAEASSEIFNVRSIQTAGYNVIPWTVNDTATMRALLKLGVNGIISDRPDLLREVASTFDGNKDGKADFLDVDSLINIALFDAQGHRGARSLRPENTLPAMEVALDFLVTTLETDCGITKDGIPILGHDPHLESIKFRRTDGQPYLVSNEVLIKDFTLAEIQANYVADRLLIDRPLQKNDGSLSPVSVAFGSSKTLSSIYLIPSLQQVFDFGKFYAEYYKTGAGKTHPHATKRWKNAERVRFNIETKINPRMDKDARDEVFSGRTVTPAPFAKAVANVIMANQFQDRADIQSFDFRTLKIVQELFPMIRTAYLFTDGPIVGSVGDGTNMQDEAGANTPWMA
ncbi:MAG TPA: glycerophosphodiester phosphodiesterase family protein, partial [Cytophagaceae bacterium]